VNPESDKRHVTALIPDYVLDLLAREDRRLVSSHLAACQECRQAVGQERHFVHAVRDTFSTATQPDARRLNTFMPAVPQTGSRIQPFWPKPLAATLLLLLVILGSLALQNQSTRGIWPATRPGVLAATVAITDTPTQTATSTATGPAPESRQLPTPKPARAAARAAMTAVSAPRPAVVPVAVSPILK
jgi:hypothetical protein